MPRKKTTSGQPQEPLAETEENEMLFSEAVEQNSTGLDGSTKRATEPDLWNLWAGQFWPAGDTPEEALVSKQKPKQRRAMKPKVPRILG
jgi:hypothetical protein